MAETRVGLILVAAIQKAGGDGLYNNDRECECVLGDLAPCGALTLDCNVGRRWVCKLCGNFHIFSLDVVSGSCSCGGELFKDATLDAEKNKNDSTQNNV